MPLKYAFPLLHHVNIWGTGSGVTAMQANGGHDLIVVYVQAEVNGMIRPD